MLTINKLQPKGETMISDKRLYLNADKTKVVPEGPDAAFLLVAEGGELDNETAKKYGLIGTKAIEAAPENKSVKPKK